MYNRLSLCLELGLEAGSGTRRDSHGDQAHQRTEHFDQGLFHLHLLLSPLWAFALSLLLALW